MTLRLTIEGATATLLIDRADKRNAFDLTMWQALPRLLDEAQADPGVRVLIIRAAQAGGAFSAGADIRELLANKDDAAWRQANHTAINTAQYRLARMPLPTIAFIEGDCVGGGCGIALACDIRVATPAARFGVTPARLGLVYPLHDVKLLIDLVGPGQARRILFTGDLLPAEEALRIGLVEELAESAHALAASIAANATYSLKGLKQMIRWARDGQIEDDRGSLDLFAAAFTAPEFEERAAAFVARRRS